MPCKEDSILDKVSIYIISKGRLTNIPRIQRHLGDLHQYVTWVVPQNETAAYKAGGATNILKGGKPLLKSE